MGLVSLAFGLVSFAVVVALGFAGAVALGFVSLALGFVSFSGSVSLDFAGEVVFGFDGAVALGFV